MGNLGDNLCPAYSDNQLRLQLQREQVGAIIRLQGRSKTAFVSEVADKKYDAKQVHRLQPETVSPKMGFLYKAGVFFYEGELNGKVMQGKGRLTLIQKRMQYEGMFNNDVIEGNGALTHHFSKIVIKGMWQKGCPKDISVVLHDRSYRIVFSDLLSNNNAYGEYRGVVYYPDKRKYEGFLKYDDINSMFMISGKGKLYYPNGDIVSGTFADGDLNGQGQFFSQKAGRYVGNFLGGRFQGNGQFYYPDKKVLKICWVKNKPHGKGTLKINNLQVPVKYQNGVRIMHLVTQDQK